MTTVGVQSTGNNAIWQLSGPNTYTGTTTIGATGLAGNITLNVTTLRDFGTASSLGYGTVGTGITFINSTAVTPILNYVGTGDSSSNRTISLSATASGTTPAVVQNNGTGNLTFTAATTTTPFNERHPLAHPRWQQYGP